MNGATDKQTTHRHGGPSPRHSSAGRCSRPSSEVCKGVYTWECDHVPSEEEVREGLCVRVARDCKKLRARAHDRCTQISEWHGGFTREGVGLFATDIWSTSQGKSDPARRQCQRDRPYALRHRLAHVERRGLLTPRPDAPFRFPRASRRKPSYTRSQNHQPRVALRTEGLGATEPDRNPKCRPRRPPRRRQDDSGRGAAGGHRRPSLAGVRWKKAPPPATSSPRRSPASCPSPPPSHRSPSTA